MSKLLREYVALSYDKNVIKEARDGQQPVVVKALLQRADEKNQNGRIYTRAVLEREVKNYQKAVTEGRATGELDHPQSSVVSLENVSHVIRDVWWDNNEVWGTLEILNTPKGQIAQSLMESGIKLGISSRGVGEVSPDIGGAQVVSDNFILICFDLVSDPSTMNAWLMQEGKDIQVDYVKQMVPKVDRVNRILNDILK